jgi:Domain of unknown function (DUF4360)
MRNRFLAGAAAGLLPVLPAPATLAANPPGQSATVSVASMSGTGCPSGSATVAMSPDNSAFTVAYSKFVAEVGAGAKPGAEARNCALELNVTVPGGYSYAVSQVDHRGFGNLAAGASATMSSNYYFRSLTTLPAMRSTSFTGPLADNWHVTETVRSQSLIWLLCTGSRSSLILNTKITVSAGRSDAGTTPSYMSMDSTDGTATTYHLTWKKCSLLPLPI